VIQFEDVGRNEATTFTGFCSEHDAKIFMPIEVEDFEVTNSECLFLIAYRALAKELHAQMEAAFRIQGSYNERVRLELDTGNEPEPVGMLALGYMIQSFATYEYKLLFDQALVSHDYSRVVHDVISIEHDLPAIAVCSLFSFAQHGNDVRIALNVLPLNAGESVAVFSYLTSDASLARALLNPILSSTGFQQRYFISKQILNSCQNFVVSPIHFDKWSGEKRDAICDYFCADTPR
jgi:hypothetical protein